MHLDSVSKHIQTDKHEKKETKHTQGHLKHQAAEALEEHQWKKHPGGG